MIISCEDFVLMKISGVGSDSFRAQMPEDCAVFKELFDHFVCVHDKSPFGFLNESGFYGTILE